MLGKLYKKYPVYDIIIYSNLKVRSARLVFRTLSHILLQLNKTFAELFHK